MMNMLNARGVHGEDVLAVVREQFHTSGILIAVEVSSSDGKLHTFWSVSANSLV